MNEGELIAAFNEYRKAAIRLNTTAYPPEKVQFINESVSMMEQNPALYDDLVLKWDQHDQEVSEPAQKDFEEQYVHPSSRSKGAGVAFPCSVGKHVNIEILEVEPGKSDGRILTSEDDTYLKLKGKYEYQFRVQNDQIMIYRRAKILDSGKKEIRMLY